MSLVVPCNKEFLHIKRHTVEVLWRGNRGANTRLQTPGKGEKKKIGGKLKPLHLHQGINDWEKNDWVLYHV